MTSDSLDTQPWVLVTGGSRGIGAATVRRLRDSGYSVAFTYLQSNAEAESLALELSTGAGWCHPVQCDMSNGASVSALSAELLDEYGAPYGIVHNAGQTRDNLLINMRFEEWQQVVDTNLNAAYHLTRAFTKEMMVAGDGCILLVGSAVALRANIGQSNYAATKAALSGFCKSLAAETGRFNIRVNVVAPGLIQTDMTRELTQAHGKKLLAHIPLRRLGDPDDIARMIEYLLGPGGRYITGQCFVVDGGLTA